MGKSSSTLKKTYILFLLLLGLKFWDLNFFSPLFSNTFGYPILMIIYLLIGYKLFGRNKFRDLCPEMKWWYWIIGGICSSFIWVFIEYSQTPIHSIWMYRTVLISFVTIPVVWAVGPTREELVDVTFIYSFLYIIVFFAVAAIPSLEIGTVWENGDIKELSSMDYGYYLNGIEIILFPLYCFVKDFNDNPNKVLLIKIIILLVIIFFIQNRSTLFPAVLLTIYALWKSKLYLRFFIIVGTFVLFYMPFINPMANLIEQTKQETSDADYNRNIAYAYYIKENTSSVTQFLFGEGIVSSHKSNQQMKMEKLAAVGIYPSDMGLLGFMNIHGIIPVVVILSLFIRVLKRWKKIPLDIKLMSLHFIACTLTMDYFETFTHTSWLMLYMVLLSIYSKRYFFMNGLGKRIYV